MKFRIGILALWLAFPALLQAQEMSHLEHEELGRIAWYRDYDIALQKAEQEGKQVFLLFQEVPGCATCRNYGNDVLSHPLLAEAIETEFIAVVIYNNKGGRDAELLKKYKEPSWNNPVVRIVDSDGLEVLPRLSAKYDALSLWKYMRWGMEVAERDIPQYFELLGDELDTQSQLEAKTFRMYCFWSGEAHLGEHDAVQSVEAGFQDGYEVVKVSYDAEALGADDLIAYAQKNDIRPHSTSSAFKPSQDDHLYYLRRSPYAMVPMMEIQKIRVNSALGKGKDPSIFLSPRQLKVLMDNKKSGKSVVDMSLLKAWDGSE